MQPPTTARAPSAAPPVIEGGADAPAGRLPLLLRPAAVVGILFAVVAPVVFLGNHMIDLGVYRAGGAAVLHGRDLYAPGFARQLSPPLAFTYPPVAAVLATPAALLPRWLAGTLWTLGELAVLVWLVGLAGRPLLARVAAERGAAAAGGVRLVVSLGMAWVSPVNDHLGFGQVNLFLLALVVADLTVATPRWPRGALIGLAAAVKLIPAVFVLLLLVTGRRATARTSVLTGVGATAVGFVVLPASSVDYWTRELFATDRIGDTAYFSNQSLRAITARLLPAGLATPAWVLAGAVVLALGLRAARRAHAAGEPLTAAVLTALVGALISPITWIHHLVWLAPAVLLVLGAGRDRGRAVAAAVLTVLLWVRLPYLGQLLHDHHWPGLLAEPLRDGYGLLCLGLLVALPWLARRATRAACTPAP